MKRTLGTQLILYLTGSILVVVISMSYILYTSIQLQQLVNDQFQNERYFQQIQREIISIREPLVQYLSSRSSNALASLLIEEQMLRGLVPKDPPLSVDPIELTKREIFTMITAYLDFIQDAIQLKRSRSIEDYTRLFETMEDLNGYIVKQIDTISLQGLRTQLDHYETLLTYFRELQYWNLLIIIFAFASAMLWMLVAINRLTDPMHRLAIMAGELSLGNFNVPDIPPAPVPEVSTVIHAFNTMKHDINTYIGELNKQKILEQEYMNTKLRNLKMEHLIKRMELYTMQAQMNPHFLFNTLNTGVQLAIVEQADQTADFMEKLAEFFRHNLREKNLIVPLSTEIEGLRSYFSILAIRFSTTLDLVLTISPQVNQDIIVPSFILQPLVENSVIHAFKEIHKKGSIEVRFGIQGSLLLMEVEDNGVGIDKNIAQRLLQSHPHDGGYDSKIMGLENVIQRLYFFYPNQTQNIVTIESNPGQGTHIIITIDTKEEPCIPS